LILHSRYGGVEQNALQPFLDRGIARERIEFVPSQPMADYLQTYNRIDVALDTFPYGGGTTTCGALWMGVPVVTLAGDAPYSRTGVSILSNIGLTELIATSTEQYIETAIAAAQRASEYRSTLRERMANSPLMDAQSFAVDFEQAILRASS
jgi:predicted O-linked N-acetylglucosamine transferase (SPINDLY family)